MNIFAHMLPSLKESLKRKAEVGRNDDERDSKRRTVLHMLTKKIKQKQEQLLLSDNKKDIMATNLVTGKYKQGLAQQAAYKASIHCLPSAIKDKITRNKQRVTKLVNNPRNQFIKFNGNSFIVTNQHSGKACAYSGLTKKLKRVFYPNTEEDPRKRGSPAPGTLKSPYYKPSKMKRTCLLYGKDHGKAVHEQLELYTNLINNGKSLDEFHQRVGDALDPCTIRILNLFAAKGWVPVVAEQQIWDEDMGVATAVDSIVLDSNTGKLILIELKNGFEGQAYGPSPDNNEKLPEPLSDITNCPMFRHMLQVMCMRMILTKKYKFSVDEAYIIRTLSKECKTECISMSPWCKVKRYVESIYTMMCDGE
jgi:hypothetical protein